MNLGICTFCGKFGKVERAHIDSSNKIMLCSSCHREMDFGEKPKPSGKSSSGKDTKGKAVREIISELEKPTRYADIAELFEKETGIEVSNGRVKQVALEMSEEGKVAINHKVNEKGNAVSYVEPKKAES